MTRYPLTFLFTDLEESTRLWEQFPEEMKPALARHDDLLRSAVEAHGGRIVKTTGDGLHAVFESPTDAVSAALDGQRAIITEAWPEATGPLRVRMGVHTGESQEREGDYYGPEVNLAARVMGLAHGGQVALSGVAARLAQRSLPEGVSLLDLGEQRLRGVAVPEPIFQLQHPDLPGDFPPLKSLSAFPNNLSHQLSTFIGREKELAEVKRLLSEGRLLTLLGPGGTGKTRLMIQAAEEVVDRYPDGVWLVELAALTDPELIPERVAAALNLQAPADRRIADALVDYLRRKDLLLLLDNVEHMVRESAELAERLLTNCPKISMLVTGREALFIEGEQTFQVPSLALPEIDDDVTQLKACEAVQLFLARARSVRPEFALVRENAAALVEVVRRLDGIPLALELAAARVRMLTVEKIAERLNDRFRLLTGGKRTALPRQQTLQALVDWSWQLLEKDEKVLLRRLSVFSGGWSLEAAEQVCGIDPLDPLDVLDLHEQLANKSLVNVEYPDGEPRYGMLESIRQFARDKLFETGEGEALRDRHAQYFVEFSQAAEAGLPQRDALLWIHRLRQELDNLRAVMAWTQEERPDLALKLLANLRDNRGLWINPREAQTWLDAVLPGARKRLESGDGDLDRADLVRAMMGQAFNHTLMGRNVEMRAVADEALVLARQLDDPRLLAGALGMRGLAYALQITPDVIAGIQEAIALGRAHNLPEELHANLVLMGGLLYLSGKTDEADALFNEATQILHELGSPVAIARHEETLGAMPYIRGDWERSLEPTSKALEVYRELGIGHNTQITRSRLGHLHRHLGNLAEAEEIYRETIRGWEAFGNRAAMAHQLECFAYLALPGGQFEHAARLIGAAQAARARLNAPPENPLEIADLQRATAQLKDALGEEVLESLLEEGAKMDLDAAVAFALGEPG